MRKSLIEALVMFDTPEAVEALVRLLEDSDSSIQVHAAKTLSKHKPVRAIDTLISYLNNKNADVNWYAACVLSELHNSAAIPILLERLQDQRRRIRRTAAALLGEIGSDEYEVITTLIATLEDPDYAVRRSAAIALANFNREEAIPELIKALYHYYPQSGANATAIFYARTDLIIEIPGMTDEDLMSLGDRDSITAWCSEKQCRDFRDPVVKALGNFEANEIVVQHLTKVLNQGLKAAAIPLGMIGKEEAIPTLLEFLRDPSQTSFKTQEITDALVHLISLGHTSIIETLISNLENINSIKLTDPYFRNRVVIILLSVESKIMAEYLPRLIWLLSTEVGEHAVWAISTIQYNCKFYNYDIFHSPPIPKPETEPPPGQTTNNFYIDTLNAANSALNLGGTIHGNQSSTQNPKPES
ncbi:MAG: HEAT repeat domain-containing protein [Geitlerinemataceae cyanobacterium]